MHRGLHRELTYPLPVVLRGSVTDDHSLTRLDRGWGACVPRDVCAGCGAVLGGVLRGGGMEGDISQDRARFTEDRELWK